MRRIHNLSLMPFFANIDDRIDFLFRDQCPEIIQSRL